MFLYGTLRHLPLLEVVLGHGLESVTLTDAVLPDYTVSRMPDGIPIIHARPGADALGLHVSGLGQEDWERLNFYEALYGYTPRTKHLRSGQPAEVYFPTDAVAIPEKAWVLSDWVRDWGDVTTLAAEEFMSLMNKMPAADIRNHARRIRDRAQARFNARSAPEGKTRGAVEILSRDRSYMQFYATDEVTLRHETYAGHMSDPLSRGVFVTSDAALVLPYDPKRDRVLLVEQFRVGPLARGDAMPWQLEPVAGLIDFGEHPEETARREAEEEAGVTLERLEPVAENYSSPGASTDFQYLFVGLCDLPDRSNWSGGLEEEGEDIRVHLLDFADLLAMAERRATANVPLTMLTYWLAHHRERLRSL